MLVPLLPTLPLAPTPLPATLIAEVVNGVGTRVYGAVDAPGWVLPVTAAGVGLIPVVLLALSKGAAPPTSSAAVKAVKGARERVFEIANRYSTLRRRLRRE